MVGGSTDRHFHILQLNNLLVPLINKSSIRNKAREYMTKICYGCIRTEVLRLTVLRKVSTGIIVKQRLNIKAHYKGLIINVKQGFNNKCFK